MNEWYWASHISDIVLGNSAVSVAGGEVAGGFKNSIFVRSFVILFLLWKKKRVEKKHDEEKLYIFFIGSWINSPFHLN